MVKHIVLWKLKQTANGNDKEQNAAEMLQKLYDLKNKIPQIVDLEAGQNFKEGPAAFDIALYSSFNTRKDLEAYSQDAEHVKVVEFIKTVIEKRVVVDYEI